MIFAAVVTKLSESDFSRAYSIAFSGLTIVFAALLLITLFVASMPRLIAMLEHVMPEVDHGETGADYPESQVPDDEAVLAAIGYVLHTEFQNYRDVKQD